MRKIPKHHFLLMDGNELSVKAEQHGYHYSECIYVASNNAIERIGKPDPDKVYFINKECSMSLLFAKGFISEKEFAAYVEFVHGKDFVAKKVREAHERMEFAA